MARERLSLRKVERVLSNHFGEGCSDHFIVRHCGMDRCSVAQTLKRVAGSGLSWPQARGLDGEMPETARYPPKRDASGNDVDWAQVEANLAGCGIMLLLLWEWKQAVIGRATAGLKWKGFPNVGHETTRDLSSRSSECERAGGASRWLKPRCRNSGAHCWRVSDGQRIRESSTLRLHAEIFTTKSIPAATSLRFARV